MNALAELAPQLDDRALADAAGAFSNYGVLLSALRTPEAQENLEREDPLASARIRGIAARGELLRQEGPPLTVDQVAGILHITRQAVDKRRRAKQLLAIRTGRRGYLYPSWQLDDKGVLDGFERSLKALDSDDPWAQAAFFLHGNIYLDGMSPLTALRQGKIEAVLRAAAAYGQHGAP